MNLTFREGFPENIFQLSATEVRQAFPTPTLLHIKGQSEKTIFISCLLHGNEHSGFEIIKLILKQYKNSIPSKSLLIFIGNVYAAEKGVRHLTTQSDLNRVWNQGSSPESKLAQEVLAKAKTFPLWASIDFHNNTGINPIYGCTNSLDKHDLYLASLYNRAIVYFLTPTGVLSQAFADLCPSVTIECGTSMSPLGIQKGVELVEAVLKSSDLHNHNMDHSSISIFRTVGRLHLKKNVKFGFEFKNDPANQVTFRKNIERLNFSTLPKYYEWGWCEMGSSHLTIINDQGNNISDKYLQQNQGRLIFIEEVIPSMFTLDRSIIENDCVGYIMESIDLNFKNTQA